MSKTVLIVANGYEEFCNKMKNGNLSNVNSGRSSYSKVKWKELWNFICEDKRILLMFILAIGGSIIFVVGALLEWNGWVVFIGIIGYLIGLVGIIFITEKNEVNKYSEMRGKYYHKLSLFNNILKEEFKIDSKEKIEFLLSSCEETCKSVEQDVKIVSRFEGFWQKTLYPVITIGIGIIVSIDTIKKSLSWEFVLAGLINFIFIYIMIIILLKIIQNFIDPYINSNKNRINSLKSILNDIILNEYI